MQLNTFCLLLFVDKTVLATNLPARLAVSLVVLPPSQYPHVSKIASAVFQQCSRIQPRARTGTNPAAAPAPVRVVSVRRNVRIYAPNLIKNATRWATHTAGATGNPPNVFTWSRGWERVAPPTLKLTPRYADSFKKRMDLPPNFHPHTGVASSNASIVSSPTESSVGDSPTDYF